jgi:hypothetical protein
MTPRLLAPNLFAATPPAGGAAVAPSYPNNAIKESGQRVLALVCGLEAIVKENTAQTPSRSGQLAIGIICVNIDPV